MTQCSSNGDCRDEYECIDEETFLLQADQYEDGAEEFTTPTSAYCGLLH